MIRNLHFFRPDGDSPKGSTKLISTSLNGNIVIWNLKLFKSEVRREWDPE